MIVEDIPFKQMFRFEAKPKAVISAPIIVQPITPDANPINWGKIIGITALVAISGFVAYKIWKHYNLKESEKKSSA
ncbi:MAG: hypothetical protein IPM77_15200 [Crocinitomicaceae bacterium]|nr:hypothetical protein [Crocinitomicaceae bacterium]